MNSKDALNYCVHCGTELTENEIANAAGFCSKPECQEKA